MTERETETERERQRQSLFDTNYFTNLTLLVGWVVTQSYS